MHENKEKLEAYQDAYDRVYGTIAARRREEEEAFLRISRNLRKYDFFGEVNCNW